MDIKTFWNSITVTQRIILATAVEVKFNSAMFLTGISERAQMIEDAAHKADSSELVICSGRIADFLARTHHETASFEEVFDGLMHQPQWWFPPPG